MELGALRGCSVELCFVRRKNDPQQKQKPSQNFVEGIFDALTSYNQALFADPHSAYTLHLAFMRGEHRVVDQLRLDSNHRLLDLLVHRSKNR